MASKKYYVDLDLLQASELKQAKFEQLASDPVAPVEGQEWGNTTDDKRRTVSGGVTETYAYESYVLEQINALGRSQGGFSAAPGLLPTAADKTAGDLSNLQPGDYWVINNGGTITGIQGDDVLSIGDKIEYLNGDPTIANNWVGIQTNLDDNLLGNVVADRQVVNLVASTPLTISSSTVADVHSVQVYDSSGEEIEVCVLKTANANERDIESNISLTGVIVELLGKSS